MVVYCVGFVLSDIVIVTLGEERDGCFAQWLLVCPHFVVSRFSVLPFVVGGGLRSLNAVLLPGDISIGFYQEKVVLKNTNPT